MMQWFIDFLQRGDAAGVAARATTVAAFIALVGIIVTTLVTFLNARRSLYVSAVTTERSKWINSLRDNISSFSGKLRTLGYLTATGNIDASKREKIAKDVNKLISLIRLQLNPFGEIDKNIIRLLERMPALAENPDVQRISLADDLLIKHSQWLLKAEWEKVKYETRGFFLKAVGLIKAQSHIIRYRRFVRTEGNLDALQALSRRHAQPPCSEY